MRYHKIRKMDISNGPGVRVSFFVQGCTFHCKNCFNPETHSFEGGKEFTKNTIEQLLKLCKEDYIKGLSILGGEPLHPKNIKETMHLVKRMKEEYPNKSIWVWTGFLMENIVEKEILKYIDVLVDGQYKDELHDPTLKWRGSKNQRVIEVQKTIQAKELVLYESETENVM